MDKAGKLDELIDGAEELLTNLTDAHDPDIQDLRDRVDRAISDARRAIARREADMSVQVRDVVHAINDYVHDYPWLALTTGVLVAGAVAFVAGAAGKQSPSD